MKERLAIYAVGIDQPPSFSIVELAQAAGGEVEGFNGWENVGIGGDEDHPGKLAATALNSALMQAGVSPGLLQAVISTGLSREYGGSWSCAAEVMKLLDLPDTCMPLDISCGCMSTITAFSMLPGFLAAQGGGYAAIVAGERLSETIDRSDKASQGLWGHGDGGSAILVGLGTDGPALWHVQSTGFASNAPVANILRVEYGGTRNPTVPPGVKNFRHMLPIPLSELRASYVNGYGRAFERAFHGIDARPDWLVCNQVAPNFLPEIAKFAGVDSSCVVVTGHDCGHVGTADIGIGLSRLIDEGKAGKPVAVAGSTTFSFAAAMLTPA